MSRNCENWAREKLPRLPEARDPALPVRDWVMVLADGFREMVLAAQ